MITSIALDHCEQLGNTLAAIAREKAGIIKSGCPVVIGRLPEEAEIVIREIAAERGAPVFSAVERFGSDLGNWPVSALAGEHQRLNAGVAALVFEVLGETLPTSSESVAEGLRTVEWAGRWQEKRIGGKRLIFEAAHNPQGAEVLDRQLAALVAQTGRKPVIAVGALGELRGRALLEVVARHAKEIALFMPGQSRATDFAVLEGFVPEGFRGKVARCRVDAAFEAGRCYLGEPEDTVVVTGSIYLIGEILERLEEPAPVREGLLQD